MAITHYLRNRPVLLAEVAGVLLLLPLHLNLLADLLHALVALGRHRVALSLALGAHGVDVHLLLVIAVELRARSELLAFATVELRPGSELLLALTAVELLTSGEILPLLLHRSRAVDTDLLAGLLLLLPRFLAGLLAVFAGLLLVVRVAGAGDRRACRGTRKQNGDE
ncbi:MAG TPA: hypothetical protein VIK68_02460 [Sphingomicrobium sp.]